MSPYATHFEILSRGAAAWNGWRKENPSAVPDLKGVSLPLRETFLNGANLREAWLQNSVLRFAPLMTADLEAADMSGADLVHAQLGQANLRAANLNNARLDHAHLSGAILAKANLSGASLRFATLSTADLQAVDMSHTDLMHARLDQANLSDANLRNARLDYADFGGANLSQANLSGACLIHAKNLTQSQLEESVGSESTILPPHLQGSVPWSTAISPRVRPDVRALPGPIVDVHAAHFNSCNPKRPNLYEPLRWRVAAVVILVALVTTASLWLGTNENTLVNKLGGERSEQSNIETSFSPEALPKAKAAPKHQPPAANMVDQTSSTEDLAITSRHLGASVQPQLAKTPETKEPDPNDLKKGDEAREPTSPVLVETPPAAWPHAIVPDLSTDALKSSVVHAGPPVRNPTLGQNSEIAGIVSNAAIPMPTRNPLR